LDRQKYRFGLSPIFPEFDKHNKAKSLNPWRIARHLCAPRWLPRFVANTVALFACILLIGHEAWAQEVTFGRPSRSLPINIECDSAIGWQQGQYEVLHLTGPVQIEQHAIVASANEAILWVQKPGGAATQEPDAYKVIVYLEGQVAIEIARDGQSDLKDASVARDRLVDDQWLGRLFTSSTVNLEQGLNPLAGKATPAIFARAQKALADGAKAAVQTVQFQTNSGVNVQSAPLLVSPQTGAVIQSRPAPVADSFPLNQSPFESQRGSGNSVLSQPAGDSTFSSDMPGADLFLSPQAAAQAQSQSLASNSSSPFGVDISARDSRVSLNFKSFNNPNNPNERVSIGTGGVRIVINDPELAGASAFEGDQSQQLVILADNLVQWQTVQPDGSQRRQFYIEGDVVFAKGKRVINADRMYYDVELQQGTILNAEVLTPVRDYRGLVRMKAGVVQQVDANNLQAYGSAFTSSRLGVPRYWLQSESIGINRTQVQAVDDVTGQPLFDPQTGQPVAEDEYRVDSRANRVYLAGVPVFAWPRFQTTLDDPALYLKRLGINNDSIFGFQVTTGWDMYQLLGLRSPPKGTEWIGVLDYLSERGVGLGSEFSYRRDGLMGLPGVVQGEYRSWFINDSGLDRLGQDRFNLVPEEDFRGRITLDHRHKFAPGFSLRAELGYITDRNFLEQYYEREWDNEKDATTGLWLERNLGSVSDHLIAEVQVNDFFAQTTWLPRFDRFRIGQSLFNDRAVWHNHSHVGYGKLRAANAPTNATELAKFDPLAWEADVEGIRAGTRQELDFPIQFGPAKVVPYVLGDITYWQEDLSGNDLTRAYGQTGIRASLPMWRVDPSIQSTLWNVNGLAHKVSFDMDMSYSDASQDLSELALYDQLDDDAQEHFRRRFAFNTFGILPGGDTPLRYDERFFAFRSNMQGNVTAPSAEIADDLMSIKLGVRQRWQTKRGMPGQERIIDWITFDAQTILFPDADRDNFGADLGMFDYDFRWHLGDRFSILSDGYADFFSQGLRTVSVGGNLSRPGVGDLYVGLRSIEGPISSNVITTALTYRMSEKWGAKLGGQYDFGEAGSIGQSASAVYIGESFLMQVGVNYDVSRDNVGFRFGFEPRFIPKPRLFRPGGEAIAPAGSRWLE
jgi:lipopolysaccharide export system protein LptA